MITTHILDSQFGPRSDVENDKTSMNSSTVGHLLAGGDVRVYSAPARDAGRILHVVALFARSSYTSARGAQVRAGESVIACHSVITWGLEHPLTSACDCCGHTADNG